MDSMPVSPQNSYIEALAPCVAVLGGGTSKEVAKGDGGHQGDALTG